MPDVAIIPIKSFRDGNKRLATALDDNRRSRLGRALASHVARTVEDAGLIPLIVTADPEVAEWATLTGFPSYPDPNAGLDSAAAEGVEWAIRSRSRWIVIHGDLPLLTPTDLRLLSTAGESGANPISPSTDGGTSAIGGTGPIDFAFGPGSFHRHLVRVPDPMIVVRPGLSLDIDSPADLARASSVADPWLREAIA